MFYKGELHYQLTCTTLSIEKIRNRKSIDTVSIDTIQIQLF